ncbi:hypothetical protein MTO96_018520 [Rhipicephalus appendiculatus]
MLMPENHQRSVALILVAASAHLFEKTTPTAASGNESASFCETQARALRPLWILDKIEYYPTRLQNDAIRSAYAIIVDAVTQRLQKEIEDPDVEMVSQALNSVRLLFPSDVVPKDAGLPAVSGTNFAQDCLSASEYAFRLRRHLRDVLNVGPEVIERVQRLNVSFDEKTLTVPVAVLHHGVAEGRHGRPGGHVDGGRRPGASRLGYGAGGKLEQRHRGFH